MAAEGRAGSSSNVNQDDRTYFGQLAGSFLTTYGTWRGEAHAPQTCQEYAQRLAMSQTATCARAASLYFEIEEGVRLLQVTGVDSHVFRRSWVSDPSDKSLCFHATFSAFVDGESEISFFFAELVGINSPQVVTSCVRLASMNYISVKNCRFCTGLWHPVGGNFLGYRQLAPPPAGLANRRH